MVRSCHVHVSALDLLRWKAVPCQESAVVVLTLASTHVGDGDSLGLHLGMSLSLSLSLCLSLCLSLGLGLGLGLCGSLSLGVGLGLSMDLSLGLGLSLGGRRLELAVSRGGHGSSRGGAMLLHQLLARLSQVDAGRGLWAFALRFDEP